MVQCRPWARRLGGAVLSGVEPAPARSVLPQLYYPGLWGAGFRLTIIPIALGIVAPFSSSLYELRPRLVVIAGMAICIAALVVLTITITGAPRTLPGAKIALAVFGAGLGEFIALNNSATISGVPADNSGEPGGLRHHGRVLPSLLPHRPRLANGSFRHCGSKSRSREGLASSLSAAHWRHD